MCEQVLLAAELDSIAASLCDRIGLPRFPGTSREDGQASDSRQGSSGGGIRRLCHLDGGPAPERRQSPDHAARSRQLRHASTANVSAVRGTTKPVMAALNGASAACPVAMSASQVV